MPWNAREGIVYGGVIAALSSLIIGGYNVYNIIINVLLMSVILSFLGGAVGQTVGYLLGGPVTDLAGLAENWPRIWPRNFCIAFWVEMLIAQPAARMAMVRIHTKKMGHPAEA